jgi:hypothetical protein
MVRVRHLVSRLRRQHRRDQHLEGIVVFLFGDFLDGWILQVLDCAGQFLHHSSDVTKRPGRQHYALSPEP